jgi:serine/threonine protein kinase
MSKFQTVSNERKMGASESKTTTFRGELLPRQGSTSIIYEVLKEDGTRTGQCVKTVPNVGTGFRNGHLTQCSNLVWWYVTHIPIPPYVGVNIPKADNNLTVVIDSKASNPIISHFIKNIAEAVHYLHENKTVHGSIHPSNVLIYGTEAKLDDFYFPIEIKRNTPSYTAPELRDQVTMPTQASDMYALGRLLLGLPKEQTKYFENINDMANNLTNPIPTNRPTSSEFLEWAIRNECKVKYNDIYIHWNQILKNLEKSKAEFEDKREEIDKRLSEIETEIQEAKAVIHTCVLELRDTDDESVSDNNSEAT